LYCAILQYSTVLVLTVPYWSIEYSSYSSYSTVASTYLYSTVPLTGLCLLRKRADSFRREELVDPEEFGTPPPEAVPNSLASFASSSTFIFARTRSRPRGAHASWSGEPSALPDRFGPWTVDQSPTRRCESLTSQRHGPTAVSQDSCNTSTDK